MKRERMLEFLRELGLDPSKTINVHLDSSGWFAEQFLLDEEGNRVYPDFGHALHDHFVSGNWE